MPASEPRRHSIPSRLASAAVGLVACALVCFTPPARADSITNLQLDLNGLTLQAHGADGLNVAFGPSPFTGSLAFGLGANANLNSVLIDGASRPEYLGTLAGVSGHLDFIGDAVAGGALSVAVRNPDASLDTYALSFLPGSGSLSHATNALMLRTVGNQAKGDTAGGTFDKTTFGGVDVSPWFAAGPSAGTFLAFKYNPDAQGFGASVDLDLAVDARTPTPSAVPLPSAAWGGLVLFAALAASRFGSARWKSSRARAE